jgi:hypothetical protein
MSQKTNLNVSPYFDDFDASKAYHKVLFNPGKPVQARELNNLQSQLQDQIEKFGKHIFKDGSMVIPGGFTYDLKYYAVKINPVQFGINVNIYIKNFIGKTVVGKNSKISATIDYVALPSDSDDVEYITLYVKYKDSAEDGRTFIFPDSESFSCNEDVIYGNTTITAGTTFATSINSNSTATGSAAHISSGVYFVRGYFVDVSKQTIILDYYNNQPSYKIGLTVNESIVSYKEDNTLYDNAKGFTNYAAPGADRFSINLKLDKRELDDNTDSNFIELLKIESGVVLKDNITTQYSIIRDYLAKRTYEESGNYSVNPFQISLKESLNDRIGNGGIFLPNTRTREDNIPSDDLASIVVSPGIAYVEGYDVDKSSITTILDLKKPRDTAIENNTQVLFKMGNFIRVNNVYGSPVFRYEVGLYNERKQSDTSPTGIKIGDARVYSFSLTDSAYEGAKTSWDLSLYDIQTYTELTLSKEVDSSTIKESYYIKGNSSAASGYCVSDGNNTRVIYVRQTSGFFIEGEQILINGKDSVRRTITNVRQFNTDDIKSIFKEYSEYNAENSTNLIEFSADTLLVKKSIPNISSNSEFLLSPNGTLRSPQNFFTGINTGSILSYVGNGIDVHYNKVVSISADGSIATLSGVSTVSGVCTGSIGVSSPNTKVNISLRVPSIISNNDGTLYSELPKSYVSSVNLLNSSISFKSQTTSNINIINNSLTLDSSSFNLPTGLSTSAFQGFDQERYSLHWDDGTIETLNSDQFDLINSGNGILFSNISNKTTNSLLGTLVKSGIKSKIKIFNKSKIVNYNFTNTGIGSTEYNLEESDIYGIRIQDQEICLNYPDVVNIVAVYESLNSQYPVFDKLIFSNAVGTENTIKVGENIVGKTSGAVARIVVSTSTQIPSPTIELDIVYLNKDKFIPLEEIEFLESTTPNQKISFVIPGRYKDLTKKYILDSGQKGQYYDYSRIVRDEGIPAPNKKLTVVFDHYIVPPEDNGDAFTVLSYSKENFYDLIPRISPKGTFATNVIDFRPRVTEITNMSSLTKSPFDFASRDFSVESNLIVSPDEVFVLGLEYYLPRIDRLYLNKEGNFVLVQGVSSADPTPPVVENNSMLLCTLYHPPFLDNVTETLISLESNRRYTMRDIGSLDARIGNLERITTLSLLEIDTKTLEIRDSDGINMFKNGFFADDFKNNSLIDPFLSKVALDTTLGQITPQKIENTLPNVPIIDNTPIVDQLSGKNVFKSLDGNVRFSGNIDEPGSLTLDYEIVDWIEQPFSTRIENVNPFHVVEYIGEVSLNPSEDNWVTTIQLAPKTFETTSYVLLEPINKSSSSDRRDFEEVGLRGEEFDKRARRLGAKVTGKVGSRGAARRGSTFKLPTKLSTEVNTESNIVTVGEPTSQSETFTNNVATYAATLMRSRNVEFEASNLKSFTVFYPFLDSQSPDYISKIIKIQPIKGIFRTGETVIGYEIISGGIISPVTGEKLIQFRLAAPNHKFGVIGSTPEKVYTNCPYDRDVILPSNYSEGFNYLNIDTKSLANEANGKYSGYLGKSMLFVGEESGAEAFLDSNILKTDSIGDLIGCFFIRDAIKNPNESLKFTVGTKTYKVTSSESNTDPTPGGTDISYAETTYTANGTIIETQDVTLTNNIVSQRLETTTTVVNVKTVRTAVRLDPLAQSFEVGRTTQQAPRGTEIDPVADRNGVFLVAADIYFAKKPVNNASIRIEIRRMSLGTVTLERLGNFVELVPSDIEVSSDGSIPTTVIFPEPIYLPPNDEYAIVLISPQSLDYEVFTAQFGEKTYEGGQYNTQFAIGSLFKSQNGSIWTADQTQDLKFKLYKAKFVENGSVSFISPSMDISSASNAVSVDTLIENPIEVYPRKILVGINTIQSNQFNLSIGDKLTDSSGNNYGFVENVGSPAENVSIAFSGRNYSNDSGLETFNIVGNGSGLTLNIQAVNGKLTQVSIASSGIGYNDGDVVGIVTSSTTSNSGFGAAILIDATNYYNSILLTNVQGENFSNGTVSGVTIISSNPLGGLYEGNIAAINHLDHGMYLTNNLVNISGIEGDFESTLQSSIDAESPALSSIQVLDASVFSEYEGFAVGGSNPGYIKIRDEIMKYTTVNTSANTLGGIERGIDGSRISSYYPGQRVVKYEISNISIRRFSGDLQVINIPGDPDKYYIEIDRTSNNNNYTNRSFDGSVIISNPPPPNGNGQTFNLPLLSFKEQSNVGGNFVNATRNIQFSEILPSYELFGSRENVSVSTQIRTVSGRSVDGNEVPYLDLGYEPIQLNRSNKLNSLRMIASRVNETSKLTELPDSRSFTTLLSLSTTDTNVSPQLFLDNCVNKFTSYRINNPIKNYPQDSRVNEILDFTHNAVYYSNIIYLSKPSTSLKVILSAYRPITSEIRLLYSLVMPDSYEVEQSFTLFPGYNNLTIDNNQDGFLDIIDVSLNDGLSDFKVSDSLEGEFRDYEYTAPNLPPFTGFIIKAVMTSTDQANPPIIKNIRAIALA